MNTNITSKSTFSMIKRFGRDTRGATMVEYLVIVGLIALLAFAGFEKFGKKVDKTIKSQAGDVSGIADHSTAD
jgi:Flp pilus assembly pilin Flp